MSDYRCYFIGRDGHIIGLGTDIAAPNDQAAVKTVKQRLLDGQDVEIWQGSRMVAYLVSEPVRARA